jgi:hypothetical protein
MHQHFNAVMTEIMHLKDEVQAAEARGDQQACTHWRRVMWLTGARKYCLLCTWRRVIGALQK